MWKYRGRIGEVSEKTVGPKYMKLKRVIVFLCMLFTMARKTGKGGSTFIKVGGGVSSGQFFYFYYQGIYILLLLLYHLMSIMRDHRKQRDFDFYRYFANTFSFLAFKVFYSSFFLSFRNWHTYIFVKTQCTTYTRGLFRFTGSSDIYKIFTSNFLQYFFQIP